MPNNELTPEAAFSRWIKGEPAAYHGSATCSPGQLAPRGCYSYEFWSTAKFYIPAVPLTLPEAVKIAAQAMARHCRQRADELEKQAAVQREAESHWLRQAQALGAVVHG